MLTSRFRSSAWGVAAFVTLAALTGCGPRSSTTSVVPQVASQSAGRHVAAVAGCDPSVNDCGLPQPPNPVPPYVYPDGTPCDPTSPYDPDKGGCMHNPLSTDSGAPKKAVGPPGINPFWLPYYQPQCRDKYSFYTNLWHQCYNLMAWKP